MHHACALQTPQTAKGSRIGYSNVLGAQLGQQSREMTCGALCRWPGGVSSPGLRWG